MSVEWTEGHSSTVERFERRENGMLTHVYELEVFDHHEAAIRRFYAEGSGMYELVDETRYESEDRAMERVTELTGGMETPA